MKKIFIFTMIISLFYGCSKDSTDSNHYQNDDDTINLLDSHPINQLKTNTDVFNESIEFLNYSELSTSVVNYPEFTTEVIWDLHLIDNATNFYSRLTEYVGLISWVSGVDISNEENEAFVYPIINSDNTDVNGLLYAVKMENNKYRYRFINTKSRNSDIYNSEFRDVFCTYEWFSQETDWFQWNPTTGEWEYQGTSVKIWANLIDCFLGEETSTIDDDDFIFTGEDGSGGSDGGGGSTNGKLTFLNPSNGISTDSGSGNPDGINLDEGLCAEFIDFSYKYGPEEGLQYSIIKDLVISLEIDGKYVNFSFLNMLIEVTPSGDCELPLNEIFANAINEAMAITTTRIANGDLVENSNRWTLFSQINITFEEMVNDECTAYPGAGTSSSSTAGIKLMNNTSKNGYLSEVESGVNRRVSDFKDFTEACR